MIERVRCDTNDTLGWDEKVRFVPYWRKDTGLKLAAKKKHVVASGWTRGKKQLMVLVLNDNKQSAEATLRIDPKKFGFEKTVTLTMYRLGGLNGKPKAKTATAKHDTSKGLKLSLPAHSFRLLRVSE